MILTEVLLPVQLKVNSFCSHFDPRCVSFQCVILTEVLLLVQLKVNSFCSHLEPPVFHFSV